MVDKERVLHCAKRIARVHALLNDEIDELFSALGIDRKEAEDADSKQDGRDTGKAV